MASNQELAIIYAALILQDAGAEIAADKIEAILKAAGVEYEPFWPGLYANALKGVNIKDLISNVGSGVGSAAAAPAAAAAAPAGGAAPAAKKEEKKKVEEKEESDDDMGFGLFD